eukprot:TRINITY_DN9659_c0_g1_i10.p1 TRINITY_DN9659_c0_g1~~TRINITY_DN9659_c0_g1_i10.p1  ORF type:complete len:143 (-),score=25.97 TRINITY_DN9659_c0_g1_i10:90-518(-)
MGMENSETIRILKEGWLKKRSKYLKMWKRRWVVMTPTHIYTYKNYKRYINPTESISITSYRLQADALKNTKKEYTFGIVGDERTFYFQGENNEERKSWIKALESLIADPKEAKSDEEDYFYRFCLRISYGELQAVICININC